MKMILLYIDLTVALFRLCFHITGQVMLVALFLGKLLNFQRCEDILFSQPNTFLTILIVAAFLPYASRPQTPPQEDTE